VNFKINALLAIWITGLIAAYWLLAGYYDWEMAGEIKGATIAIFTLIAQHYFRKVPPRGSE